MSNESPAEATFFLLTQDDCPRCEVVKKMLAVPLKGLQERVEIIHRQRDTEDFEAIVARTGVQTTPALVRRRDDAFLVKMDSLYEVKAFLSS